MNLTTQVNKNRHDIEHFIITFLVRNIFTKEMRNTIHYRQWYSSPMNYVRHMEIPLAMYFLKVKTNERLLDVGSPKLLSLFYGLRLGNPIVSSDLHDYFIRDFTTYANRYRAKVSSVSFDAASYIPYPATYFDKIFSISVIEHIPDSGDTKAMLQMTRVLKPGGRIVLTVPAYVKYFEEWLNEHTFYWKSQRNQSGQIFFQRHYDKNAILERLQVDHLYIKNIIYLAEKPIKPPKFSYNGRFLYNWQYGQELSWLRALASLKFIPLTNYIGDKILSHKFHYLTKDHRDRNIRQAVISISKDYS